jgi:LysR family transcriptional regulator, transcriptional activator of nhaA
VSMQIRELEASLDCSLFKRQGRRLVLTEDGRTTFRYAEEIFSLGNELAELLSSGSDQTPVHLAVGVVDAMPRLMARRLIQPALDLGLPMRLLCRQASPEHLLSRLAVGELDLVLSDVPIPESVRIRAFSYPLAESAVVFMATPELAARYRRAFPASLNGCKVLLPTVSAVLRKDLEQWFTSQDVQPVIVGEFEDNALIQVFGSGGMGLFPVLADIEHEIAEQYGLERVGEALGVREKFYAISVERTVKHPAVAAICGGAEREVT